MREIISKELFSAVARPSNMTIEDVVLDNSTTIRYYYVLDTVIGVKSDTINIYELADRCKKWGRLQDNVQEFKIEILNDENKGVGSIVTLEGIGFSYRVVNVSEPEAIFKACEWIMEQKDKA